MPAAIEVRDLVYDYPGTRALDRVGFALAPGSITAQRPLCPSETR